MTFKFFMLGAIVLAASCNTKPKTDNTTSVPTTDTTGLAAFQAMKAQNELGIQNNEEEAGGKSEVKKVGTTKTSNSTTTNKTSSSNTASTTSSSTGTSTQKKGWSKTAKGAVIGGVAGAAGGAIINKKNRAAGAVIGGVLGAGTGAIIGNEKDRKDGRH